MTVLIPFSAAAQAATTYLYDDSLHWDNWSWGTNVDFNDSRSYDGSNSMAVTYERGWASLSLHSSRGIDSGANSRLEFAVAPHSGDLPDVLVSLYDSGGLLKQVGMEGYADSKGDGWYYVSIPLGDLGANGETIHRVQLQSGTWRTQPTFNVDSLKFTGTGSSNASFSPQEEDDDSESDDSSSDDKSSDDTSSRTSGSSSSSGSSVKRSSGDFQPSAAPEWIDDAIRDAAAKYNLPRWFLYALIHRESSFNHKAGGGGDGDDKGLTQMGGPYYYGTPYPMYLSSPDDDHKQYAYDMGFSTFGKWIDMDEVTRMENVFDPEQHLDRFATGYAVPAFYMLKDRYGLSDTETLRAIAWHWNKGIFRKYDSNNWDYLGKYDKFVDQYKGPVEDDDGKWNGKPRTP